MIIDLDGIYGAEDRRDGVSDAELAEAVKALAILWADDDSSDLEIDKAYTELVDLADKWARANG